MSQVVARLDMIEHLVKCCKREAQEDSQFSNNENIGALIRACETVDRQYKEMCDQADSDYGDDPGTNYQTGMNIEFYIQASDWHTISTALRKIKETVKEPWNGLD